MYQEREQLNKQYKLEKLTESPLHYHSNTEKVISNRKYRKGTKAEGVKDWSPGKEPKGSNGSKEPKGHRGYPSGSPGPSPALLNDQDISLYGYYSKNNPDYLKVKDQLTTQQWSLDMQIHNMKVRVYSIYIYIYIYIH